MSNPKLQAVIIEDTATDKNIFEQGHHSPSQAQNTKIVELSFLGILANQLKPFVVVTPRWNS
jgi:hypothetical protein